MADQQQIVEPEMAARSPHEPGQQRKSHCDTVPNASVSTQRRAEQSHVHPKRSSTLSDPASSTRASRHRSDHTASPINHKASTSIKTDGPKTGHARETAAGGGFLTRLGRILGLSQDSEQGNSADEDVLLRKLEALKKDNASMQATIEHYQRRIGQLHSDNEHLQQRLHHATQDIGNSHRQYREVLEGFKTELKQSNARAAKLERQVAEDEEKLSKAYTAAVSTFARDVSRDLPDDIVKSSISTFFQGDFFSWCADMCAPQTVQQELTVRHLRSMGIINSGEEYLKAPEHLHFDMNSADGSSSLVLLQAVLAKTLCDTFLASPFFLARHHEALTAFEEEFSREDQAAAVDWRIRTVACLETIAPIDAKTSARHARQFEHDFGPLLRELDEEAREDLGKLFTDFALLALKLWKVRTRISVSGNAYFAGTVFELGSKYMDGDPTTVSSLGRRLNGRPIGVVMRPLIISMPIVPEGRRQDEVVWSKAFVWVSPHV